MAQCANRFARAAQRKRTTIDLGILQRWGWVEELCLTFEHEAKAFANESGRPNGHTQHDKVALVWSECGVSDPPMSLTIGLGHASESNASSVPTGCFGRSTADAHERRGGARGLRKDTWHSWARLSCRYHPRMPGFPRWAAAPPVRSATPEPRLRRRTRA